MIYIDGPKPGINSNLQAVLVDDARSDPRLIPFMFGPKNRGETEKNQLIWGGSSILWGILNEFWMTWGPQWSYETIGLTLWWTNILPWKITMFNGKIHYFYGHFQ